MYDNTKQTCGLQYGINSKGKLNFKKGVEPERDHLFELNYKSNLQYKMQKALKLQL